MEEFGWDIGGRRERMHVRGSARRLGISTLIAVLALAVAAPELAGQDATTSRANLEGTWTTADGVPWHIVGNPSVGDYSAVYHGTGAHSKLVGNVQGHFGGLTWSGTVHVEEPNQVEGGPATIADDTFSFSYDRAGGTAVLEGDIVAPTGDYPTKLTCQRGPCREAPCRFVVAPSGRRSTDDEKAIGQDLEDLLEARFPDASSCRVQIGGTKGQSVSTKLDTDVFGELLDNVNSSLEHQFPDAPEAVRNEVARATVLAANLSQLTADQGSAFPSVRALVDSGTLALVAGAALKPPGNPKAAQAMSDILRLAALSDSTAGAT